MLLKREELLKEMKSSVGTKEPIVFFEKMADVLNLLFDRIDSLEKSLQEVKTQSALAIQWEPKVASDLLSKEIEILRQDKETYHAELSALKQAYAEGQVVQSYANFCNFWQETLGWHPFIDYDK